MVYNSNYDNMWIDDIINGAYIHTIVYMWNKLRINIMSNLSRLRRRSAYSAKKNLRTSLNEYNKPKKQTEQLTLLEHSLKYGDIMICGTIEQMLNDYMGSAPNLINNGVFNNIECDRVGLFYSPKMKEYMYLAINHNFTCSILWKSANLYDLPNLDKSNNDQLGEMVEFNGAEILQVANRKLWSVFKYVHLLTTNPLLIYSVTEVFKK